MAEKNQYQTVDWDRFKGAVLRDTTTGNLFTLRRPTPSDNLYAGPPGDLLVPYTKNT